MSNREPDLISIVIPTHNRSGRLLRAIESVQGQSWPCLEIIVVDDASSDDTPVRLRQLAVADARVRWVRNLTPQGGGGSRNIGLAQAQGTYVAFLDDDDVWHPDKLALQHALLDAHPEASATSCSFTIANEAGTRVKREVTLLSLQDDQQLLRANCLGGASMCLARRAVLERIGGFDPRLPSGQDWDLWLRLSQEGPILVHERALVYYIPHAGSRITGNLRAEYLGRRMIYIRYRRVMNSATRAYVLRELCFYRRVLLRRHWPGRLSGLCWLWRIAPGLIARLRYAYRLAKAVWQGRLRQVAR